jgi:hypothetical protein
VKYTSYLTNREIGRAFPKEIGLQISSLSLRKLNNDIPIPHIPDSTPGCIIACQV